MVLFILRKLILQTRMGSHPVGLDVWFLVGPVVYFHTSFVRTAKALVRLGGCAGSPEPSLVACVINTIISWAGSFFLCFLMCTSRKEPRHDKTNKISVHPTKTQISLGIRPVWSESLLCAQWVANDPRFLHADSEDTDQTGRMPRLIWVFAGRTATLFVLSCRGSDDEECLSCTNKNVHFRTASYTLHCYNYQFISTLGTVKIIHSLQYSYRKTFQFNICRFYAKKLV